MALTFIDLPIIVQEKVLRSLSYTELSRLRSISKHFHRLCSEQLNRGYFQLEVIIHDLQRQIKTKLPRRESERHKVSRSENLDSSFRLIFRLFAASSINKIRHNIVS